MLRFCADQNKSTLKTIIIIWCRIIIWINLIEIYFYGILGFLKKLYMLFLTDYSLDQGTHHRSYRHITLLYVVNNVLNLFITGCTCVISVITFYRCMHTIYKTHTIFREQEKKNMNIVLCLPFIALLNVINVTAFFFS